MHSSPQLSDHRVSLYSWFPDFLLVTFPEDVAQTAATSASLVHESLGDIRRSAATYANQCSWSGTSMALPMTPGLGSSWREYGQSALATGLNSSQGDWDWFASPPSVCSSYSLPGCHSSSSQVSEIPHSFQSPELPHCSRSPEHPRDSNSPQLPCGSKSPEFPGGSSLWVSSL